MTVTGQKKISVFNPATGTVVQLNNIDENGTFEPNPSYIYNSQGGRMFAGDSHKAEFTSLDLTGYDQLETWMKDRTPVQFVTYGLDEHILWYESVPITVKKTNNTFKPYQRAGFTITFERHGGEHKIYKGKNILFLIYGWRDSNLDSKIDNYNYFESGGINNTYLFTSNIHYVTNNVAGLLHVTRNVVYPISGVNLNLYINKTSADNYVGNININVYDYGNNFLANSQASRESLINYLTPSNLYSITFYIVGYESSLNPGTQLQIRSAYMGVPNQSKNIVEY